MVRLQRSAGNKATADLIQRSRSSPVELTAATVAVQRHPTNVGPDPADPVEYAGVGPAAEELDHESRALRHALVDHYLDRIGRWKKGDADRQYVVERLGKLDPWKNYHAHRSQVDALVNFLNGPVKQERAFWDQYGVQDGFDAAIAHLGQHGNLQGQPLATAYANQILNFDFGTGTRPVSLLPSKQLASTGAYWEYSKKAIFVSRSLVDPVEILAAILFECENAAREDQYAANRAAHSRITFIERQMGTAKDPPKGQKPWKDQLAELQASKGRGTAAIEFEADRANQGKLRAAHNVATQLELCQRLAVPQNLLGQQKAYQRGQPLPLPPRTELRGQEARNALWWYWVENWTEQEKKETWEITNHAEVFGATAALYGH